MAARSPKAATTAKKAASLDGNEEGNGKGGTVALSFPFVSSYINKGH